MTRPPGNSRVLVLGAAVVALGALVLWRWYGASGSPAGDAAAGDTPSLREQYLDAAALTARQKALVDAADRWAGVLAEARARWDQARHELVKGRTQELAEASFRERVLGEVKDLKFVNTRANSVAVPLQGGAAATGNPGVTKAGPIIRPIALKLEVDTDATADVYKLIDRLENLPDVRVNVSSLKLTGPGFRQVPGQVTAELELRALAVVTPSGAGEEG